MTSWQSRFAAASADRTGAYEQVLVPSLFHPWACLLVGQLDVREGSRVLDVACGPGTLARVLAGEAGVSGTVTGTDISPAMLSAARAKPVAAGAPQHYLLTSAAPLEGVLDGAYDLTCCQHGLQFFPDRPAAIAEWYRVTASGGNIAVAVWSPLSHNPAFAALHDAAAAVFGDDIAAAFTLPWSMCGDEVAALLEEGGFTEIRHRRRTLPTVFPGGIGGLRTVYRFSPIAGDIQSLTSNAEKALTRELTSRLEPFVHNGVLSMPTRADLVTARRP
ncbi:class I SAM-dependent methyltransferase [Streptomyces sp. NPDC059698]|uniref:class I SAM-dependent methyltransferase n=1 Tax=Streptomyces TaxID=1883 RepID=UPI00093F338C|nr:class I SAM-dependent methyltransferase [Streptomyces sp. CB02366]OKJ29563.1 hypothetical protein AMK24_30095 [Streptomyces sp. CB02366]